MALTATGAATSSGAAVLAQVMALAATGAQAASGAADLNIVMGLAASGVGTSSGAADLLFVIFTLGFFSSQQERPGAFNRQRPYWRYDGPLSAGVPIIRDISVVCGKPFTAWSMALPEPRWSVTIGKPRSAWTEGQAVNGWFTGPVQTGWETDKVLVEEVA